MERDEFIKCAVEALVGCMDTDSRRCPTTTSTVSNGRQSLGGDEITVYEKIMYDYPDVNEMELRRLILYVDRYRTEQVPTEAQGQCPSSFVILRAIFGDIEEDIGEDPMIRRKMLTAVENMQRGAQTSWLWQELYGLHIFSILSRRCGNGKEDENVVSYEDLFGKNGCDVREVALDEEEAWRSGRLVAALTGCLQAMSSSTSIDGNGDVEVRMDLLFEVLKYSAVQSMDRGRSYVVNAIYDGILRCEKRGKGVVQSMVRCRVVFMTAALIMECGMTVKHGYVQRVLSEVLAPEMDARGGREGGTLLVTAAAVCVEYLVRDGIRKKTIPSSWKSSFESDMIRCGIYNACIQEFIRLTKQDEPVVGELCTVSRALLLTACFSEELRAWSLRVPGYVDAWGRYADASPVLKATWKVVSSMPENDDGHVLVLQEIFSDESSQGQRFLPSHVSISLDGIESEEQWIQQVAQHLSMLALVSKALQGTPCKTDNSAQRLPQLRESIEREREIIHSRISNLSAPQDCVADVVMIQEEEDQKKHGDPRQPSLLLIQAYRECDGLLKTIAFSLKDSTRYTSSKHD